MSNKTIINLSLIIISLILLIKIKDVFVSFDDYIYLNELFINYEGGFLRRGLLGQIALYIFKNFSVSPVTFFSVVFSFANIIFFYLFIKCINKFKSNIFLYLVLLLSPATLMFSIFDSANFFNSQIFILISILLHCFIALKYFNETDKYKKYFVFLIIPLLFLNIFQYDPQVITLSSHMLITYIVLSKELQKSYKFLYSYIFLLIPILFVVLNNGSQAQVTAFENMKEIVNYNYSFIINEHPESFSEIDTKDLRGNLNLKLGAMIKIFGIEFTYIHKVNLFLSIILAVIFFMFIFGYFISQKIYFINIRYKIAIISFIPLLSLLIFITDFGRSIHIFLIHLLSFYFLFKIDKRKEKVFLKKINFFSKSFIVLSIIIYCNFWTLSHASGWVSVFNPSVPSYSKYSSYTNEFNKILFNVYYYTDNYIINLPTAEFMKPYLKLE